MTKLSYEIEIACQEIDQLGECPMWHPTEHRLYWVDTRRPALRRLEADGTTRTWEMPSNIGSFVFARDGGIVVALKQGFCRLDPATGALTTIVHPEPQLPENRLNDGRCDRRGRFWCGTRDAGNENPGGSLYRLDPDESVHKMDSGFIVSNGMAFSPDDKTLVFGDSRGDTIWRYDFDLDTGAISNKRVYLDTRGLPWRVDGATFDADGYYWCALIGDGAVGRFDPHGRLERMVRLPVSHPTMCNFGGAGLDVLYVTSTSVLVPDASRASQPLAGAVFAIHGLGARGVPEPFFSG
ncbi:SMP-30/gluconolactonase/LRE family protein [Cupriavidus basilensis]|uniref:SMP-30/gluconolactonase/LRE family protein n=1 Tax=Cupriavidus basilensis TaxID=68895 RepID=UPI000750710C|nr:SMP-30/gluconolactonase/LRE family protein [Cupriavidus basilensis]